MSTTTSALPAPLAPRRLGLRLVMIARNNDD